MQEFLDSRKENSVINLFPPSLLPSFCSDSLAQEPITRAGGMPASCNNEIVAIIATWDLDKPKRFLVNRKGFNPTVVENMEREYKRFMTMVVNNPTKKFPISEAVDELWHAHILFTTDYNEFSKRTRGSYIHHLPTLNEAERLALEPIYHENTIGVYRENWGEPEAKWWPAQGDICFSCS